MAASGLHISFSAEPIGQIGGLTITNSMLLSLIASALLILFAVAVRSKIKHTDRPTGLQNFAEMVVEGLYSLVQGVTNSHQKTRSFLPLVATFFLFILLNNWLGLFPGVGTIGFIEQDTGSEHAQLSPSSIALDPVQVQAQEAHDEPIQVGDVQIDTRMSEEGEVAEPTGLVEVEEPGSHEIYVPYLRAGTADLNTTIALATISVIMIQVFGFMYQQFGYFSKFINFSNPINFFVGLLEIILEFAKILSFSFRLFGNIFAGEVLLAVITFLVPIIVPMPFYGLEIVVGVIQALVFAMLSVVFYNMATVGHEEH